MVINHTPRELRNNLYKATKIQAKPITVKWLRKVEKSILEEPKRLNMDTWGGVYEDGNTFVHLSKDNEIHIPKPACNTIACIAGHVLMVSPEGRKYLDFRTVEINGKPTFQAVQDFPYDSGDIAAEILKLTQDEADKLFSPPPINKDGLGIFGENHWPQVFIDAYSKARTAKQRAYVAVNRIESFLETLK